MASNKPASLTEIQARKDRAAAAHTAELATIAAEQKAAAELQAPLGAALQDWRNLHDRILRGEGLVKTFTDYDTEYEAKIDAALDHPDGEHGEHLYGIARLYPGLEAAARNINQVNRWLAARRKQLVELENGIADLMKTRGNLSHLLPDELSHLAQ